MLRWALYGYPLQRKTVCKALGFVHACWACLYLPLLSSKAPDDISALPRQYLLFCGLSTPIKGQQPTTSKMATIRSLLNPAEECEVDGSNADSNKGHLSAVDSQSSPTSELPESPFDKRNRKKQKMCKDAAVFKPGVVRGECRYPPDEFQDELLEAKHQMFEVYPIGDIATYPRHIPYNSEKKLFWEKTGRESFEGTCAEIVYCHRTDQV
jgi:hypothetical protein